ncbi:MAG TPA: SDR family oxidoreductase [Deltaproteobacteria bacterium]|nr:SDR family oxidoreductase [Deltaproteobacteria bacterium]
MSLDAKHAVVTGAGGGLGRALCQQLAERGVRVSALDIDEAALKALERDEPAGRIRGVALDITNAAACSERFDRLRREEGPIDLLINNAGITHFSRVEDVAIETIEQVMAVNFSGAVNCTKVALPDLLERRGQIVVLSSVAGFAPLYGRCAYSASKHALQGFFGTLRCEVRDRGVNVLIVCPSFIDTQRDRPGAPSPYAGAARPGSARATVGKVLSPEVAAREIVEAIAKRREQLLVGRVAKQSYWLRRLLPGLYDSIMTRQARAEVAD